MFSMTWCCGFSEKKTPWKYGWPCAVSDLADDRKMSKFPTGNASIIEAAKDPMLKSGLLGGFNRSGKYDESWRSPSRIWLTNNYCVNPPGWCVKSLSSRKCQLPDLYGWCHLYVNMFRIAFPSRKICYILSYTEKCSIRRNMFLW